MNRENVSREMSTGSSETENRRTNCWMCFAKLAIPIVLQSNGNAPTTQDKAWIEKLFICVTNLASVVLLYVGHIEYWILVNFSEKKRSLFVPHF